jgi:hypothetical protein
MKQVDKEDCTVVHTVLTYIENTVNKCGYFAVVCTSPSGSRKKREPNPEIVEVANVRAKRQLVASRAQLAMRTYGAVLRYILQL